MVTNCWPRARTVGSDRSSGGRRRDAAVRARTGADPAMRRTTSQPSRRSSGAPSSRCHLVLASPNPLVTRTEIAEHTGVLLSVGGAHVGRGTRNWLGRLGADQYLELIGPDPEQPEPPGPRPFGVDDVTSATLATWCARDDDLDNLRERAAAAGLRLGAPFTMERDAPAGRLRWRLCLPEFDTAGGIIPFFIDWNDSRPSEPHIDRRTVDRRVWRRASRPSGGSHDPGHSRCRPSRRQGTVGEDGGNGARSSG